jgi:hypoxanthine-guanine phosphoribosyltransferase
MNLRLQVFRGLVLTAILAALVGSFRLGLERGFDHTIGVEAYGRMLFAISAAVSDEVHGKHGYVIDDIADSTLTNSGLRTGHKERDCSQRRSRALNHESYRAKRPFCMDS